VAGNFSGRITLGGQTVDTVDNTDDVFVMMLDAQGKPMWSGITGSAGEQVATGVAFDPDGAVIITGTFANNVDFGTGAITALEQDTFLTKLDRSGKPIWVQHFSADDGGPSGVGESSPTAGVAVDSAGNIAIAGTFSGTFGFGGAPLDTSPDGGTAGFVAKLDPDGKEVYSLTLDGDSLDVNALAFDADGDLIVTGANRGELKIGDGDFVSGRSSNAFVVKLSPRGEPLWAFQIGGDQSDARAIAVGANGDMIVGGAYAGSVQAGGVNANSLVDSQDGYVLHVSADGTPTWLGDVGSGAVSAVALDDSGQALAVGVQIANDRNGDLAKMGFLATVDGGGNVLRASMFSASPSWSFCTSAAASGADAIVAGNFSGSIQLGSGALSAPDTGALFIARVTP
jgi:hypothetical protein